jgi:hypothetical protein
LIPDESPPAARVNERARVTIVPMRRTVLIVPEWVAREGEESVLRGRPNLARAAELGEVFRVVQPPVVETPEALWLGLPPAEGQLRQGPLTVAALGADPPERSAHFHLSLLALEDGVVRNPHLEAPEEEVRVLMEAAERLNTSRLTIVRGESRDHGLVWEGREEFATRRPEESDGKPILECLPEGDDERPLRRFIDDSVNLLSELELNARRMDEGLLPFNLLWPWGEGRREPVPNLLFRRGERAHVLSPLLRLEGLTRLVGYRHGDRRAFGRMLNVRLEHLRDQAAEDDVTLSVIPTFGQIPPGREEERDWFSRELDARLVAPLTELALREPMRLTILAPSSAGPGLGLCVEHGAAGGGRLPFDERALEERTVRGTDLWLAVEAGLSAGSGVRP